MEDPIETLRRQGLMHIEKLKQAEPAFVAQLPAEHRAALLYDKAAFIRGFEMRLAEACAALAQTGDKAMEIIRSPEESRTFLESQTSRVEVVHLNRRARRAQLARRR